jgi:hypothetical protein
MINLLLSLLSSLVIQTCLLSKMIEKRKEDDPARDQSDSTSDIYLRSFGAIKKSNLEEIVSWETINSA